METDILLKESYRILEISGGDPQSPFFHAEESASGAPVIIRAFAATEAGSEEGVEREEELRATLKHPALLPLSESWQEGSHHFQAFRCPSTSPLRKALADGISPSRALEIARDLASTFRELHARGLCSGILTPDTVFLSEEGKPLLFHIGLPSSASIRTCGDHRYITPEQAQGKSADCRSDIYRLGLLLYEMLAGEAPYQAENSVQLTMLHLHGPPPKLPSALCRYQNLIDNLLAKEPLRRPAEAEEVRRQIKLALNEKEPRLPAPPKIAERKIVSSQEADPAGAAAPPPAMPVPPPVLSRKKTKETTNRFYRSLGGAFALGAVLGASFLVLFMGPHSQNAASSALALDDDLKGRLLSAAKLQKEGQTDEAVKQLEALLSIYPQHPEPRNNLAALLASRGELEHSSEVLSEAMRLDSRFATISENLEVVRQEIARRTYSKALNLEITQPYPELKPLPIATAASGDEVERPQQAVLETPSVTEETLPKRKRSPEVTETEPVSASTDPEVDLSKYAPEEREVIESLQSWARAWSDEDVEGYLDHYSRKFAPSDGLTLAQWKEQRRQRLAHPQWISVTLEDFQINTTGPDTYQVKLIQEYRSDTYSDRSLKSLNLVREDGKWRIYLERSLGIIE